MIDIDRMLEIHRATRLKRENDDGSIESKEGVHCPHCGHFESEGCDLGESGVYSDGEHDFTCQDCGAEFVVETAIEYTWTSTKLEPQ